jgi:YebC/PmpR family DNA-binding regulatory protein
MSGHSKWKTIKHKKALADAKRSKNFTKVIKEITVAARSGGGDPSGNPRLRFLLDKARDINMPSENAQRAIKKGTGELPGVQYESYMYEGYGPAGIAVLLEVLTDNKNKAIAEVRHVFSRKGGILAETGSVNWMFERLGVITTSNTISEDRLLEELLPYEIKDITDEEDGFTITCSTKSFEAVKQTLTNLGVKIIDAEIEFVAKNTISLPEPEEAKAIEFLEAVEELDDVQNVYSNLD